VIKYKNSAFSSFSTVSALKLKITISTRDQTIFGKHYYIDSNTKLSKISKTFLK